MSTEMLPESASVSETDPDSAQPTPVATSPPASPTRRRVRLGIIIVGVLAVLGSAAALASSVSVGYMIWLIRGGQVIAALMAHLPAWKLIDPTYVLENVVDEEDDSSLQDVLEEREELIRTNQ